MEAGLRPQARRSAATTGAGAAHNVGVTFAGGIA